MAAEMPFADLQTLYSAFILAVDLRWNCWEKHMEREIRPYWLAKIVTVYYAVKKVFVNFFAKFFEVFAKFFKVFASFLRFPRAFRGFRIHSDPLGCIRMHSEAFGSVWTFSKISEIFGFLSRFSTFPDVIFTKVFFHGTIRKMLRPEIKNCEL